MKRASSVFAEMETTVFEVMSRLAQAHGAINLGQGFPDGNGPADVRAKAQEFLADRPNQYPPMRGDPDLRAAVAANAARSYGLSFDPATEVLVTSGATEALACCLLGLIEPGDEVVLIEPLYDSYLPIVRRAGGIPRLVRLLPPDWSLPREDLAAAFSPKTKLIVINTPMNPTGKVFDRSELGFIAELIQRHDAYAVCDEVYEHLVYDGRGHVPLMCLPGMRERCLRIGSAGKTFSLTGWKIGYICGTAAALQPVINAHQFITFTTPPNLQRAVAYGLNKDASYFRDLADGLERRRDLLSRGLADLGFEVFPTGGTYFITTDIRPLSTKDGPTNADDAAFCRTLTTEAKVAAIPVSAFYEGDAPRHFIRFAFCKEEAVLVEALTRLRAWLKR